MFDFLIIFAYACFCFVFLKYIDCISEPKSRNGNGYLSEPEKGYESDFGENRRFQNLDSEHIKHMRRS